MRLTRDKVRAIEKAVRAATGGSTIYTIEYGMRPYTPAGEVSGAFTGTSTGNSLLWDTDADLIDMEPLTPGEYLGDDTREGFYLFDLYLYGRNTEGGFAGNMALLLDRDGNVSLCQHDPIRLEDIAPLVNKARDARLLHEKRTLVVEVARTHAFVFGSFHKETPLGIIADWLQDRDDPQADELREAIAAGYE